MIDLNTYKFNIDGEELTAAEITERWPNGVEIEGNLSISDLGLVEIPFKIKTVGGDFECRNNQLTSLAGCPKSVGESFHCDNNQLASLKGGPKSVGKGFYCDWLILMHNSDISKYIPILKNHYILSYYNYITKKEKYISAAVADGLLRGNIKKNQQVINNLFKFASSEVIQRFYTE